MKSVLRVLSGKGLIVLLLLLAGASWAFYLYRKGQDSVQYRMAKVERGRIVSTISATGTLNAVTTVQVGSQITGMIKHLYADFNSQVKKGQLIARIDPESFEAKLRQAEAELENAKATVALTKAAVVKAEAELANAKATIEATKANVAKAEVAVHDARIKLESREALFKEGGISQEERDSAKAAYDSAVAQLEAAKAQLEASQASSRSAQAQLEVARSQLQAAHAQVKQKEAAVAQARVDLDHTFIRAPVDGIVISRNVDVGQTVAASLQAPTLFIIAQDLTKMQVNTNVDESDIGRVRLGQEATFTVDSFPGQTFQGRVVQIRQAPIVQQNVVTYDVVIAVANPELKLMPGMTANVRILVAEKANILKIPNAALRFRPPRAGEREQPGGAAQAAASRRRGEEQRVWVFVNGQLQPLPVKLGMTDGAFTEVVEGALHEGQEVVVGLAGREGSGRSGGASLTPQRRGPGF
ncbi:MAG: efflux RND transporter periplasmic adaptor subunit [Candidatus Methylomirabilales bacterium]